jgi:hypothetical protein
VARVGSAREEHLASSPSKSNSSHSFFPLVDIGGFISAMPASIIRLKRQAPGHKSSAVLISRRARSDLYCDVEGALH